LKKNTATKWIVFAFDRTDNTPKTGDAANITANVRIDGGAADAVDDTNPAELEDGYYVFDITAAECNGDLIVICPASTTANIQVIGVPGAVWTDTLSAEIAVVDGIVDDILVDTAAIPTDAVIADAVWDEVLNVAGHNVAASAGKRLRQVGLVVGGSVNDAAATTTSFISDVTGKADGFYKDQVILFTSGALDGQTQVIADYNGTSGLMTMAHQLTSAPANGDAFDIIPTHVHSGDEIAEHVWADANGVQIAADTAAILVDTGATLDAKIDSILADTGTDIPAAIAAVQADTTAILADTGTTLNDKIDLLGVDTAAILVDTGTDIPAAVAVVDANVDAILADTDELETDWVNGGRLDLLLDIASATNPTAADIADAVWDEAISGHAAAGSTGEALAAAQSAGDPWTTALPGAYAAGTAGKKLSDMAVEVTAVLVDTGTDIPAALAVVDANVDAILADTGTDIPAAIAVVDANVDAILVDTGTDIPAAISALPAGSAPTAAAIADAVWDEVVTSGHAVGNSAAVKLVAAAAGLATSVAGLGAIANVITVTVSGVPLQNVDVWVTSDEAGTTVVAGTLQTDVNGQVTFYLDAGTYYVWQQKTGYNFTCPDELTVT
jgi:hypothetical protein